MKAGAGLPHIVPPVPDEGESWFVVHSRPRSEYLARDQLEQQGFRCFVPSVMKTVRHARQLRSVVSPFFPRYFFTILDLERDRWRSVNGTIGVSGLIMAGIQPRPVPPGVVEPLVRATNGAGLLSFREELVVGDDVRILSGPFADRVGTLARLDARDRVAVLLDIMGAPREMRMGKSAIAPIRKVQARV